MQQFFKKVTACAIAVLAVSACSQNSSSASSTSTESSVAAASAAPAASSNMMAAGANGQKVYDTNCSSCHQTNGQGSPGAFPPLAGNPVVTGDATKVIHIVKYGLGGSIAVAGKTYNGMMPAWGTQLSNGDIAAAITYVRSAWGNKAGPVTEAQVAAVNK